MFTPDPAKSLNLKTKYKRGWYQPPTWDHTHPERRALWWVQTAGQHLVESSQWYAEALLGEDENLKMRSRAVVAADRGLLVYWVAAFRRQAHVGRVSPAEVQEALRPVLNGLDRVWGTIGPQVGPEHLEQAQRGAQAKAT